MDYLNLNSARRILETVAANNGTLTWYNIVKTVDQFEDVERVPPSFYVLQDLTQHGYLAIDPPEEGNQAKYWMTKLGLDSLGRGKTREKIELTYSRVSEADLMG